MNKTTKKYLVGAGVGVVLLGGLATLVFAVYIRPMIIEINSHGNILMRGTVVSAGTNALIVKSWAGNWTVNISPSTTLLPENNTTQFHTGDFVGVQGAVNQNTSLTIDATLVRDWTVQQTPNNKPAINGISGPTALDVNQTGTWTINANEPQGNFRYLVILRYSVLWGDEANYSSMKANGPALNSYGQTATFTHAYATPGLYTPTFYVTDAAGNTTSSSISVDVGNVISPPTGNQCNVRPDANGNCPAGCVNYGMPLGCVTPGYKDYCNSHPGQCPY